ncbi:hypothetical protein F5144DRAFT_589712 [Chaetomium tenue]|uniref:Uncharacterized protein n=1 Tax=Chaetomium tenue TaxID=1854479 RepID=A0ACB7PE11_9PEZI|nr:hypothetical protein F5144DRAFT_589712 [Chaetomium globosum]
MLGLDLPEHLNVGYRVECRDIGNNPIASMAWDGPFNLERELELVLSKTSPIRKKDTVFDVITVLGTTVPMGTLGVSYFRERPKRGFIGDPNISVDVNYTKIVIFSRVIISALKSVASYDTQDKLEGGTVELNEPFALIGHHIEALESYAQRIDDGNGTDVVASDPNQGLAADAATANGTNSVSRETRIHVGLVLDFVRPFLKDAIAEELARYRRDIPTCTYRMLWYLFRPGETVYVKSDEGQDAYMVGSVEMDKFSLSSMKIKQLCHIKLWHLESNGVRITRGRQEITIKPFKGEKMIESLDVVPCKIWDKMHGGELRAALEERGKKWIDHLQGKHVEYRHDPIKPGKRVIHGRAYADPASYYSLVGTERGFEPFIVPERVDVGARETGITAALKWARGEMTRQVKQTQTIKELSDLVDDAGCHIGYLLCSRTLEGFVNPFAKLVMPEERKKMIKALVYKYTDPRYASDKSQVWGADFIKHKGEGLVFLLHGGPGVGKTYVKCIAEFTGRPLLALTCGDIGTEEVAMEKRLRQWLELAHKWGAVMLIDEADVFLEKRMDCDIKRNSLVSVFLREIEYYQGILFLTSNRVGKFDDAIVSRIHVVIHYRGLDRDYRREIWDQFFDKLEEERGTTMKIRNSARRYVQENKKMVDMKWNGREIRNGKMNTLLQRVNCLGTNITFRAFQTAVALAEYRFLTKPLEEKDEGETAMLEEEDFKQICDMTMKFREYLTEMNEGQDEEMRARSDKLRADDC